MNKIDLILVDAHIHIHSCYVLEEFFNSAKSNFMKNSLASENTICQAFLCLTESQGINVFLDLKQAAEKNEKIGFWQVNLTNNSNVLYLSDISGFKIYIIAGRQIVTAEKLEVLALGLTKDPGDGKPIDEAIQFVVDKNSIPVIPWGVGKWFGNRKKIVENLVQNNTFPIYLGDNGNRPFFWSKPEIFELAAKKSILNIPGSDPLPFNDEVNKPGSFGFVLEGILDIEKPFDSLYEIITSSKAQFETFGRLESLFNFFKNQILMQVIKRKN